jgi:hypothetical protein
MICVQFIPPYSNHPKRVEVAYKGEGYLLRNWLREQGASAEVVLVLEDVTVLDHPGATPNPETE